MDTTVDKLPFSKNLFWDVAPSEVGMDKYCVYVVNRVLDRGRWGDWLLIRNYYGLPKIKEIALGLRSLNPKSLSFIATVTYTPEKQFRCYKLLQSPNTHWYF
jgi:hypothetical protein